MMDAATSTLFAAMDADLLPSCPPPPLLPLPPAPLPRDATRLVTQAGAWWQDYYAWWQDFYACGVQPSELGIDDSQQH